MSDPGDGFPQDRRSREPGNLGIGVDKIGFGNDAYQGVITCENPYSLLSASRSCTVIAQQIEQNKNFAKASDYRRGSTSQRNPITPVRMEQMKQFRTQGLSIASIVRQIGCSMGRVCHRKQ